MGFAEKQREVKEKVAKEIIYEAALKVISQNENITMQDIAHAAGIATGTLYNYFENKESLLYYVDRKLHDTILDKMRLLAEQQYPAMDRLKNLTVEILRFCEENHVVFDTAEKFGIFERIPKDQKRKGLNQAIQSIKKILDDGVSQRAFTVVDTESTARFFFFSLIGVMKVQQYIGEYNLNKFSNELLKTFGNYLGAK